MRVKWDHIHLRSSDPDAAAAFYELHFGAAHRARAANGDQLRVTVDLSGVLLFIDRAAEDATTSAPPVKGIDHLAFTVQNLEEALAHLRRSDVEIISGPVEIKPGVKIAFVRAPDQVRIELLERG